jgi:hypothetical protein
MATEGAAGHGVIVLSDLRRPLWLELFFIQVKTDVGVASDGT